MRRSSLDHQFRPKRLRKLTGRGPPFLGIPWDARDLKLTCSHGHDFVPPWHIALPEGVGPTQYIDPNFVSITYPIDGITIGCPIPQCSGTARLVPPQTDDKGDLFLFGDESEGLSPDGQFRFVYSFAGLPSTDGNYISETFRRLKLELRPDMPPDKWVWHTVDLRRDEILQKWGVALTRRQVDVKMSRLAKTLAMRGAILSATMSPVVELPQKRKKRDRRRVALVQNLKNFTIATAICFSTDFVTEVGFTPKFILERVDDKLGDEFMDLYVEQIGRVLFGSLAYYYVSRQKLIELPLTTRKSSRAEAEIADFLAYWVRRHFEMKAIGRRSEIPLEHFGRVIWVEFSFSGVRGRVYVGYPDPWDIDSPADLPSV